MKYLAFFSYLLSLFILTSCQRNEPLFLAPKAQLVISPVNEEINLGTSITYQAFLVDETGQLEVTVDTAWSTADGDIANFSQVARAQGVGEGSVQVTAEYKGLSATALLVVTDKSLEQLLISPREKVTLVGLNESYSATAVFEDGTTQDITDDAKWSSSAPEKAGLNASEGAGVFLALESDAAPISIGAEFGGERATALLEILDGSVDELVIEPSLQYTPVRHFVDYQAFARIASSPPELIDVTSSCVWTAGDGSLASANYQDVPGRFIGLVAGDTEVRAQLTFGDLELQQEAELVVTDAVLARIDVYPSEQTIQFGNQGRLEAIGIYEDGSEKNITDLATWSTGAPEVASIVESGDEGGTFEGLSVGQSVMTATFDGLSDTSLLKVNAPSLISISLTPSQASVPEGLRQAFSATALYEGEITANITNVASWSTANADIAIMSSKLPGTAFALSPGETEVKVAFQGKEASASLEVAQAQVTSLRIQPGVAVLPLRAEAQFSAFAEFDNGQSREVTQEALWSTSSDDLATVSNAPDSKGLVTTVGGGDGFVEASFGGETAQSTLNVRSGFITFIRPKCEPNLLKIGDESQCTCTAHLSNGDDTLDCTVEAQFVLNKEGVVEAVSNLPGDEGRFVAVAEGVIDVNVIYANSNGHASITVED